MDLACHALEMVLGLCPSPVKNISDNPCFESCHGEGIREEQTVVKSKMRHICCPTCGGGRFVSAFTQPFGAKNEWFKLNHLLIF